MKNRTINQGRHIFPSLLSANYSNIEEQIRSLEYLGVEGLHLDIMDGHFVPNISFGPPVIASLRKCTTLYFDVHLMIEKPERYIKNFVEAGADGITVHIETLDDPKGTLELIRSYGVDVGITLNPGTSIDTLDSILPLVDLVLVMSVQPGFGGQKYLPGSNERISQVSAKRHSQHLSVRIEVDGGIDPSTIGEALSAGAELFVAGNAVFRDGALKQNYLNLKEKLSL